MKKINKCQDMASKLKFISTQNLHSLGFHLNANFVADWLCIGQVKLALLTQETFSFIHL